MKTPWTTDQISNRKVVLFGNLIEPVRMLISSLQRSGVDLTQWRGEVEEIEKIIMEKDQISEMIANYEAEKRKETA